MYPILLRIRGRFLSALKTALIAVSVFTDNEFRNLERDTVYYVKAIEEPSKVINAGNLRCEYDALGNCTKTNICNGSPLITPYEDDCLEETEERAWSSPIYIDYSAI